MNAVGRLGSYISRSVYTVSGPFHPFGGAVDIIVVEQPDGSFKSSPWYVRFGKFQGVLKAREKIVSIVVNGVEADFHMYLDHKGEAHFIREVEGDADSSFSSPSSRDDTDGQSHTRWPVKSKSCNYDSHQPDIVTQIDASNGNVIARTNSRRSRILGFVLGRRSAKENRFLEGDNDPDFVRKELLESAEIAADLLEVKWSRSLVSSRRRNNGVLPLSSQDTPDKNSTRDLITDGQDSMESIKHEGLADDLDGSLPLQQFGSSNNEKDHSSNSGTTELQESVKESVMAISCLVSENVPGASPVENSSSSMSQKLSESEKLSVDDGSGCLNLVDVKLEARGEEYVLGNLQTTELTFEEKCQPAFGSNFTRSSCFEELAERDLCIFSQNGKSLECEGVPLQDMESQSSSAISSLNSQNFQSLLDKTASSDGKVGELESHLDNNDDPFGSYIRRSESPEAEQLFFGDLDDMNEQRVEPMSQHHVGECELLSSQVRMEEENQSLIPNHVSVSSSQVSGQEFLAESAGGMGKLKAVLSDVNIHETIGSRLEDTSRTARSLPNMSMHDCGVGHPLKHAPDSGYASQIQSRLQRDVSSGILEVDSDHQPSTSPHLTGVVRSIENLKNDLECATLGRPSEASPRSWKSWSFTSNQSRSMKWSEAAFDNSRSSNAENVAKREDETGDDKGLPTVKATKRKIRATTPSSEQLKSLKLKEGTNIVAFTFATPMLGKQEVDARIHLWKWDSRIVISDVDGTITRSDLLGQVMPLVGVDWSQTGVAHLFSAIKENGYHVLFLSARAISQAYLTRQFLCNLKQDGKALPEGPVVISPDGLFPSLYREVVRRAPHEFKISCLEAIKALFPPDRNPFYAGFGNRDTDEISYLKVGIPKGKIFIINPKGEIVVNSRVDRNSYKSLHALVNDMFPLMSSSEQEDFNSWNYWKVPLPPLDI